MGLLYSAPDLVPGSARPQAGSVPGPGMAECPGLWSVASLVLAVSGDSWALAVR